MSVRTRKTTKSTSIGPGMCRPEIRAVLSKYYYTNNQFYVPLLFLIMVLTCFNCIFYTFNIVYVIKIYLPYHSIVMEYYFNLIKIYCFVYAAFV